MHRKENYSLHFYSRHKNGHDISPSSGSIPVLLIVQYFFFIDAAGTMTTTTTPINTNSAVLLILTLSKLLPFIAKEMLLPTMHYHLNINCLLFSIHLTFIDQITYQLPTSRQYWKAQTGSDDPWNWLRCRALWGCPEKAYTSYPSPVQQNLHCYDCLMFFLLSFTVLLTNYTVLTYKQS